MKIAARVKDTTTTAGTANIVLSGTPATGFLALSGIGPVGTTFPYYVDGSAGEWEAGIGTITAANTFSRAPESSSNAGTLVNFSAGTKTVFCDPLGSQLTQWDRSTGARVYYLSKMGATDDAVLDMGSTTFGTDSTAAIQAVLNLASSTNPIRVVVDGRFSTTGLRVKGYTHIEAMPGCGMILRTGSNKSLLENYNLSFTAGTRTDKNIHITGGIWNGNGGPGGANNTKGNPTVGLNCVMRFYGVENLDIAPDAILNFPSYGIHALNVKRYTASRVKLDAGASAITNTDGINCGGNSESIVYRDLIINSGDDPISVSPDDVWRWTGGFTYPYYPATVNGPIKDVLIDNVVLNSQIYGVRLMSGASSLDNVTIRKLTGYTANWALLLDNRQIENDLSPANGVGVIGSVLIDEMDVAMTSGTAVIRIRSSVKKFVIKRLRRNDFSVANLPTILVDGSGVTIDSLEIDGYDSYDASSSNVIPHISIVGAVIKQLKINNTNVRRGGTPNGSSLVKLTGGASIETLVLNNIEMDGLDNLLLNTAGSITNVMASNIVHLNPSSGKATLDTASTIPRLNLSAYIGTTSTAGTITTATGDGIPPVVDVTAPTILSAIVSNAQPTKLVLTASESLATAFVPATSAFSVSGHTVSAVAILGTTITLTVDAFIQGEARTVSYAQPGTNNVRDLAGNLLANFSAMAVANNVGSQYVTLVGDSFLVENGTTKSLTGNVTDTYYKYLGAAGVSQLAGDGWVSMKYTGGSQIDQIIGFNTANSTAGLVNVGLNFGASNTLNALVNSAGGQPGSPITATVGRHYRVRRTGINFFIDESADNGVTWTLFYTFAGGVTAAGTLYVVAGLVNSGTIPNMNGGGLS